MKRRLQSLNLEQVTEEAIEETAPQYLELNQEQLYEGTTSQGTQVSPRYRSPKYARVKNEMNPAPGLGVPDLYVTGAFYEGQELKVVSGQIEEDSNVDYAEDLYQKYPNIAGLDEEKLDQYRAGPFKEALEAKVKSKVYG